jgi:hypothetical protein
MGHAPADVWRYTPRQIAAFLSFAVKRKSVETAQAIITARMAAHGDAKDIKKHVKELLR